MQVCDKFSTYCQLINQIFACSVNSRKTVWKPFLKQNIENELNKFETSWFKNYDSIILTSLNSSWNYVPHDMLYHPIRLVFEIWCQITKFDSKNIGQKIVRLNVKKPVSHHIQWPRNRQ